MDFYLPKDGSGVPGSYDDKNERFWKRVFRRPNGLSQVLSDFILSCSKPALSTCRSPEADGNENL